MDSDSRSEDAISEDGNEGESLAFKFLEEDYPFEELLTTNKPPTTAEASAVLDQLFGSRKRLSAFQRKIWRLEDKIEEIRRQEEDEERRNVAYQRVLAPIKQIPDEMLGEVFLRLHSVDKGFPLRLGLVCSTWRRVILRTAELWTAIQIFASPNSVKFAQICLGRCGINLPLFIQISNWDKSPNPLPEFTWLEPYRSRIRKLVVTMSDHRRYVDMPFETCIPTIPGDSFEGLEELRLDLYQDGWDSVKSALFRSPPKAFTLKRLHLAYTELPPRDIPINVDSLTHLSLKGSYTRSWDLRDVLRFLSKHPNLISVEIIGFTQSYGQFNHGNEFTAGVSLYQRFNTSVQYPSPESERILLSNIKSLSIGFAEGTAWFLERITLPSLTSLELHGAIDWTKAFRGFAERSSCALENFTMNNCVYQGNRFGTIHHSQTTYSDFHMDKKDSSHQEEQIIKVLEAFPSIRNLTVVDSMFLGPYLVKNLKRRDDAEGFLGPNLRHLSILHTKDLKRPPAADASTRSIFDMLDSRWSTTGQCDGVQTRDGGFVVYHSGSPYIPLQRIPVMALFEEYGGEDYEVSEHIFF